MMTPRVFLNNGMCSMWYGSSVARNLFSTLIFHGYCIGRHGPSRHLCEARGVLKVNRQGVSTPQSGMLGAPYFWWPKPAMLLVTKTCVWGGALHDSRSGCVTWVKPILLPLIPVVIGFTHREVHSLCKVSPSCGLPCHLLFYLGYGYSPPKHRRVEEFFGEQRRARCKCNNGCPTSVQGGLYFPQRFS